MAASEPPSPSVYGPPRTATKSGPPASVTHFGLSVIALLVVLATMYALRIKLFEPKNQMGVLMAAVAVPVVLLDIFVLKVHLRPSTGIDWDRPFVIDYRRVATKLLGMVMTLAPFGIAYWTFPEYNPGAFSKQLGWGLDSSFYNIFYEIFTRGWPGLVCATVCYFAIVDSHMREPLDTYWRLGRVALGKWDGTGGREIANHYRGWLVKAYFFPLMFVWLSGRTHAVVNWDLSTASWSNLNAYSFLYEFIFFIDLVFTTVGYALCFRPIDTHIRTAEPTMLGWAVALFCYEPFYSGLMERQYTKYGGNDFQRWLEPYPTVRWIWAGGILVLITIYVLATITFGVRFSNLTHRGILTNGPYRFTKHPAYVSKNMSWWMGSVPFVLSDDFPHALRRCMLLGVMNFMYFMRAKTEEIHLSRDPTYVAYATWMNEHGWLRFLNWIPIFRYHPPVSLAASPPVEGAYRDSVTPAQ